VIDDVVDETQKAIDNAQKAYDAAKDELDRVNNLLDKAEKEFDDVKKTFQSGIEIFQYIAKFGSGGIVSITSISFDVSLQSASGGNFEGGINLQFLGEHNLSLKVSFNLRDISSLARNIFKKITAEIKNIAE